jgi:mannitol/fructose-specific phosphotransferase system IIA component
LFGAPEPAKFVSTPEGSTLAATAAIHFPSRGDKNRDKLLALEKLALDIFEDGQAARAFAVNPDEYLRRAGFANVKLDLNSQEVKIAMAVGDPAARRAAMNGDVEGFIDAVLAQGIQPSVGLGRFVHVEALVHSSVVVYFIAAVVTFQKITTATAIPIVVIGAPTLDKAQHLKVLSQIAAHLGDRSFSRKVASQSAEEVIAKYNELARRRLGPHT